MVDKTTETTDEEGADAAATEETKDTEGAKSDDLKALEILKEIQVKLDGADKKPAKDGASAPTYNEVREKIKEETGFTDAQVDFHLRSLGEVSGPVLQKVHMIELGKKHADFEKHRADVEKELDRYPAHQKGDPLLIENIFFMVKGKRSTVPEPTKQPTPGKPGGKVISTRVVPEYPGFESGQDTGGRSDTPKMTDQEKQIARGLGIKEDRWIKAKSSKYVRDLKESNA